MFESITHDIKIEVEPAYVLEQSDPKQSYYFFSYRVRIHNLGTEKFQLVSRHWIITDGFGQMEEVAGQGVIGVQPVLMPGEVFEYSSFCPLNTPTGSMQGEYTVINSQGARLLVKIPFFILSEPSHFH